MIYPSDFEARLGVDQLRNRLQQLCHSEGGQRLVESMQFSTDHAWIQERLQETQEFRDLLEQEEAFPDQHFYDGSPWIQRLRVEGNWLESSEYLFMAFSLETLQQCRQFLNARAEKLQALHALVSPVAIGQHLVKDIRSKIDDEARVRDQASEELAQLRRRMRTAQQEIRRTADSVFRHAVEERWVPEGALPTIRDGRTVIPILAEFKRRFRGFILDESATGQTVFMEPAALLEANNELRELEYAERREIVRILISLADRLRQHLPELQAGFEVLAKLDFIRAKARLALTLNAIQPIVEAEPGIDWRNARHPILILSFQSKREVVPLTLQLTPQRRVMLVSGPNAGGKSVALKTVGLLQYLLQCGMLVPMDPKSVCGVFHEILLDIGDQQSMENDLSTYSSHLRNMKVFLQNAGRKSLVLLDELGGGTDPNFGGAIAQTILGQLIAQQVWGMATTHYYNLKLFAGQHSGITNAAMRFDDRELRPLFQLEIGQPGSSFALEIARQSGLPENLLLEAESLVGKDLAGFEKLVRDLNREKQELATRLRQLENRESEAKKLQNKYQQLATELESRKKEILVKAREEAARLLSDTNREIEKTIRHIRENRAEKKETRKVREGLEGLKQKVQPGTQPTLTPPQKAPWQVGDVVRLAGQDSTGKIVAIQGKQVQVRFGQILSTTKLDKLEPATGHSAINLVEVKLRSVGIDLNTRRSTFSSSLDLRGRRADEVLAELEKFIDEAVLLAQGELRIVHGKGEGVLRKIIRDYLKRRREIASFTDEHADRGGDGITLVVLK